MHYKYNQKLAIPLANKITGRVVIPGSKSLSNRALLLAALARGQSTLSGVLDSDDTRLMCEVLRQLGIKITSTGFDLNVEGCDGQPGRCDQSLYVENAGTVARFITAALCLGRGTYHLHGSARMHTRPMAALLQALRGMGCDISSSAANCLPLTVYANHHAKVRSLKGGEVKVAGETSSQFLSALMMVSPFAQKDVTLLIEGELVSRPYVTMTQKIMADFGVHCHWQEPARLLIPSGQHYLGRHYEVEADASSASYFFAAAAVTGGEVCVQGLRQDSLQGDLKLLDVLEKMGCTVSWGEKGEKGEKKVKVIGGPLKGCEVDMREMSDVAPTLAIVGLFAEGKTTITNVANMRVKECDRIAAVCSELRKLGAQVQEWHDGFSVMGAPNKLHADKLHGALIETYNDHRIAMAFAVAGLKIPGVEILNPACVTKTFPQFFDLLLPLVSDKQARR